MLRGLCVGFFVLGSMAARYWYVLVRKATLNKSACWFSILELFELLILVEASAAQRAGRAGRTRPGKCFRISSTKALQSRFISAQTAGLGRLASKAEVCTQRRPVC